MRSPRRRLLGVVLGSIAVNAVLGIYALLAPHFGDLQLRVLGTSACVTGAGVFALACLPALERGRVRPLAVTGIAGSALAFALAVGAIWAGGGGDSLGKTIGTAFVVAVFGVLSSVLSLARLAQRYRWAFSAAVSLAALLGAVVLGGIWGEPSGSGYPRALGVVAVLLASATLAVPILHRASRDEVATTAPSEPLVRFCPACGAPVAPGPEAETTCARCGARFEVTFP